MTLDQLPRGRSAKVVGLAVSTPIGRRLVEMGLTPGVVVEVRRRAPFGGPLEVWVRQTRICLRASDAKAVEVDGA